LGETVDDACLIRRAGAGDRAAMALLYERHADALYAFIRARLNDHAEAGDVMHEAFLEVWRSAGRFAGRSAVRTWMFAIARYKSIDVHRRSASVVIGRTDASLPDEAPDPYALLEATSEAANLRACISQLSECQRSAIYLAFYQELSYHDIAAIEGVPVGTIKTRIHHAKQLLKRRLATLSHHHLSGGSQQCEFDRSAFDEPTAGLARPSHGTTQGRGTAHHDTARSSQHGEQDWNPR
jgi:RNA polymerase sigma-70 factor, ECF subfamily